MNLKVSLFISFLVLTLFVYGCAKTSEVQVESNVDASQQAEQMSNDITDFDQIDQDLGQLEDINVEDLDF